jgi:hypothetical protein
MIDKLIQLAAKPLAVNTWEVTARDLRDELRKIKCGRAKVAQRGSTPQFNYHEMVESPLFMVVDQAQAVVPAYYVKQLFNTFALDERVTIKITHDGGLIFSTTSLNSAMNTHIKHISQRSSFKSTGEITLSLPPTPRPLPEVERIIPKEVLMSTPSNDSLKAIATVLLEKYEQGVVVATEQAWFENVPTIYTFRDDKQRWTIASLGQGFFDAKRIDSKYIISFAGGPAMTKILDEDGYAIAKWSALTPADDAVRLLGLSLEAIINELKSAIGDAEPIDTVLTEIPDVSVINDNGLNPDEEIEIVRSIAGDYAADQAEEYLEQHAPPPITLDVYDSLEARLNQIGNDLAQLKAEIKALS